MSKNSHPSKKNQKIAIVKIGAIGDVVMALYLLDYYKKKWPDCHITWVSGKTVEPILKRIDTIDELLTVDEEKLFKMPIFFRIKELLSIQFRLFLSRFDIVLTCHTDSRYRLISALSLAKDRKFCQRTKHVQMPDTNKYHGYEYVKLAHGNYAYDFTKLKLPKLQLPGPPLPRGAAKRIVISPGGAKNILSDDALRRWPIENYSLLARIIKTQGHELIIAGSVSDEWILPYFSDIDCIKLIGKSTLIEFLSILKSSDLLITHDSGPLHLAKLAHCPVIGLFGPVSPESRVAPKENILPIFKGKKLPCSPCYDGKTYAKCSSNRCMQLITPEEVFLAIEMAFSMKDD